MNPRVTEGEGFAVLHAGSGGNDSLLAQQTPDGVLTLGCIPSFGLVFEGSQEGVEGCDFFRIVQFVTVAPKLEHQPVFGGQFLELLRGSLRARFQPPEVGGESDGFREGHGRNKKQGTKESSNHRAYLPAPCLWVLGRLCSISLMISSAMSREASAPQ